jgi:hypothetical protein
MFGVVLEYHSLDALCIGDARYFLVCIQDKACHENLTQSKNRPGADTQLPKGVEIAGHQLTKPL